MIEMSTLNRNEYDPQQQNLRLSDQNNGFKSTTPNISTSGTLTSNEEPEFDDSDIDESLIGSGNGLNVSQGKGNGINGLVKEKRTGRRKIKIEYIDDKSRRHITFSKRKAGIMKKAYELSTLTGTQVLLLVASETGHVYTFATTKLQPLITKTEGKTLIQSCLNAPDVASDNLPYPSSNGTTTPTATPPPPGQNAGPSSIYQQQPTPSTTVPSNAGPMGMKGLSSDMDQIDSMDPMESLERMNGNGSTSHNKMTIPSQLYEDVNGGNNGNSVNNGLQQHKPIPSHGHPQDGSQTNEPTDIFTTAERNKLFQPPQPSYGPSTPTMPYNHLSPLQNTNFSTPQPHPNQPQSNSYQQTPTGTPSQQATSQGNNQGPSTPNQSLSSNATAHLNAAATVNVNVAASPYSMYSNPYSSAANVNVNGMAGMGSSMNGMNGMNGMMSMGNMNSMAGMNSGMMGAMNGYTTTASAATNNYGNIAAAAAAAGYYTTPTSMSSPQATPQSQLSAVQQAQQNHSAAAAAAANSLMLSSLRQQPTPPQYTTSSSTSTNNGGHNGLQILGSHNGNEGPHDGGGRRSNVSVNSNRAGRRLHPYQRSPSIPISNTNTTTNSHQMGNVNNGSHPHPHPRTGSSPIQNATPSNLGPSSQTNTSINSQSSSSTSSQSQQKSMGHNNNTAPPTPQSSN